MEYIFYNKIDNNDNFTLLIDTVIITPGSYVTT